jgi:hypothetical protein
MGKMVRVIEKLQLELDIQGGIIIIDLWSDEKQADRKLTEVRSYPFSFLVRSFLPPEKASTGNSSINSEDEGINIQDVDTLLSEVAAILRQWSLYSQFIASKYRGCCHSPNSLRPQTNANQFLEISNPHTPEATPLAVPDVLVGSNLQRKVSDKLIPPHNLMSTFFLRGSIGDMVGVVTRVNYNLREVFGKTMQILMVANMEEDEWEELRAEEGEDGMSWVLSEEEKKRARDLVRG